MTGIVPFKTSEGHDELARRTRRLGQRHRTVLLLVDGRRSADQVLSLAHAAGVAESYYRGLLELGLIALPEGVLTAPTVPAALDAPSRAGNDEDDDGPGSMFHVELPMDRGALSEQALPSPPEPPPQPQAMVPPSEPAVADETPRAPAQADAEEPSTLPAESVMPTMHSLLPDSTLDDGGELWAPVVDGPLEEAREILLRAVRAEAPVAGQLTLLKLKRAADRAELEALLDEVEARISRPRKMIAAAQTLSHVRHLLCMPPSTAFTMY